VYLRKENQEKEQQSRESSLNTQAKTTKTIMNVKKYAVSEVKN
jgi:hypothetical protein